MLSFRGRRADEPGLSIGVVTRSRRSAFGDRLHRRRRTDAGQRRRSPLLPLCRRSEELNKKESEMRKLTLAPGSPRAWTIRSTAALLELYSSSAASRRRLRSPSTNTTPKVKEPRRRGPSLASKSASARVPPAKKPRCRKKRSGRKNRKSKKKSRRPKSKKPSQKRSKSHRLHRRNRHLPRTPKSWSG